MVQGIGCRQPNRERGQADQVYPVCRLGLASTGDEVRRKDRGGDSENSG